MCTSGFSAASGFCSAGIEDELATDRRLMFESCLAQVLGGLRRLDALLSEGRDGLGEARIEAALREIDAGQTALMHRYLAGR